MCVRTLIVNEQQEEQTMAAYPAEQLKIHPHQAKLTKAKEKYIKIHEEIIEKDLELINQRKSEEKLFIKSVSGDILSPASDTLKRYSNMIKSFLYRRYFAGFHRSILYKIVMNTTQPAHVITIAALLCVTSVLLPTPSVNIEGRNRNASGHSHSVAMSFIYLASFVTHFGAQIWMTFVSGLSLYFALPRHDFAQVQRVLFPRYFTINATLSLITLLIFVKHHPAHTWDTEIAVQIGGMSSAFFLELLIRLYLTPSLLALMVQKNTIERAAGVGSEIGRQDVGSLKHCPHYLKIHRAFRRVHMTIAVGNILTMACTVLHLYYIANKLCVL